MPAKPIKPVTDKNGVPLKRLMIIEFTPRDATPPILARLTGLGFDPAQPVRAWIEHVVHGQFHDHDRAAVAAPLVRAGNKHLLADHEHCQCRHCRRCLVDDNYRHDFADASETIEVRFDAGEGQALRWWNFHLLPSICVAKSGASSTPPQKIEE